MVHHINEDKTDDRIENLLVLTTEEHTSHHHAGRSFKRETRAWNKLTEEKIKGILELQRVGYKNKSEIARLIGVSGMCVAKYIMRR